MLNEFENDNKNESLTPQPQNAPSAADQEKMNEMVQQFKEANLKKLKITAIDQAIRNEFNVTVGSLEELKTEVFGKKDEAQKLGAMIKEKVNALLKYEEVNINQREYLEAEKSVSKYLDLLQSIIDEVAGEISRYSLLFPTDGNIEEITVWKKDPDNFQAYVAYAITNIKKYVKAVRKNLIVSYSRYSFGFESQIKKINYLEAVLIHEMAKKAGK